jgi:hypothetical protein
MDIERELREIGSLMASAGLLMSVREEVSKVMREGFVVTDGGHCSSGQGYNVVVKCGSEKSFEVARRIRAHIKNVNVSKIAEGVLGIKESRRGGRGHGV